MTIRNNNYSNKLKEKKVTMKCLLNKIDKRYKQEEN
jgi:hypothetical protein